MMTERDAPRYIVPQKIPTPISSIIVAISVANGIRVMHDLQQLPTRESPLMVFKSKDKSKTKAELNDIKMNENNCGCD